MTEQTSSSSLKLTLNHYVSLVRRYELLVLIVVFTGTLVGGVASFYLPSIYEARTIFLMEQEGVSNPLTKDSTISTRLRDKLQTINEVIQSRQFLLRVIDKLNLDAGLKSNVAVEKLLQTMGSRIDVNSRRRTHDIFEITYKDENPQRAKAINETIANMFIEDNLEVVRRQQNASLSFIEAQLEEYKQRLEDSELRLRKFKEVNLGEMPSQENATLVGLERYQVELEKVGLELREAQLEEAALKKQLSGEKPMVVSISTSNGTTLEGLKLKLARLLSRYTEKHPEVIQTVREIERLKSQPPVEEKSQNGADSEIATLNPTYQKLREELMGVTRKIEALKDREGHYEKKIKSYNQKVLAVPAKEQELARLTRDYNVNNEVYQLLLKRKAEAQITRDLDLAQRGERFTILEPATVPLFPVKPNRPKILFFSLVLSCMLGAGVLVLKDSMDDSFRSVDDVRSFLQVPVLAIIPDIPSAKSQRRRRFWRWALISIGTLALILLGVYVAINDQRLLIKLPFLQEIRIKAAALSEYLRAF